MDERRLNKLIKYYKEVDEITKQLEILSVKIDEEEGYVLENMQKAGTQSLTRGGLTLYISRTIWASLVNHDDVGKQPGMKALETIGLKHLIKPSVNASQLSSWVREYDPDKRLSPDEIRDNLPEPIQPEIKISEVFKLGKRKAKSRKVN